MVGLTGALVDFQYRLERAPVDLNGSQTAEMITVHLAVNQLIVPLF